MATQRKGLEKEIEKEIPSLEHENIQEGQPPQKIGKNKENKRKNKQVGYGFILCLVIVFPIVAFAIGAASKAARNEWCTGKNDFSNMPLGTRQRYVTELLDAVLSGITSISNSLAAGMIITGLFLIIKNVFGFNILF